MERKRESQEVWEKRIERLRAGDLTDVEFATELGVNLHTLRAWKYRLSGGQPTKRIRKSAKPTFVEVTRSSSSPTASVLEIVTKTGVRIRVPVGFDEATLSRVLCVVGHAG